MTTPSTKRSRATQEQLNQMVDFMYDNPGFTGSKSLKFYGKIERDRIWNELADVLNSLGGAVKTYEQWQVVWRDLKSRTSIKVRARKGQKAANGHNNSYQEPITDLEKRVIAVIGRDYIESHDSEKDLEYEEEACIEMPTTSANTSDTYELPPQRGIKRLCIEDEGFTQQKNYLEIVSKQADALKNLAESNAASVEVAKKQADALKILAECSAANVESAAKMTESIKSMTEGIKATADALHNLANVINRIGAMPFLLKKRPRLELVEENNVEPNTLRAEYVNNLNETCIEDEELQGPSTIIVKSETAD